MSHIIKNDETGPDYSSVRSIDEAKRLVDQGDLVPLLLLPEEFGGDEAKENVVYVPNFVKDLKNDTDRNSVLPLAIDGKVTRYCAEPRYQGKSVVPIAIKITATKPATFVSEIAIWGDALTTSTED